MPIPNPEEYFNQAEFLSGPAAAGQATDADIRRAISTVYYGLFHFALTRMADGLVGESRSATPAYQLAYRSVGHNHLAKLCTEVGKSVPAKEFAPFFPGSGVSRAIKSFAAAVVQLQRWRSAADYDPGARFTLTDVRAAVSEARAARDAFLAASADDRLAFLALLAFPLRRAS